MNVAHIHTYIHRLILLIVLCCMGTNNAFAANKYLVTNDLQCDKADVVIPDQESSAETSLLTEFIFKCTVKHPTTEQRLSFDIKGLALPFAEPPQSNGYYVNGQCASSFREQYANIETPKTRTLRENLTIPQRGAAKYTDIHGKRCCLCKIYKPAISKSWIQAGYHTDDTSCNTTQLPSCSFRSYQYCVQQCQKEITRLMKSQVYVEVP